MGKAARIKRQRRPEWAAALDARAKVRAQLLLMLMVANQGNEPRDGESPFWAGNELETMRDGLDLSDAFYVHPRIMNLIDRTADSFSFEALQASDLLSDRGFALFPELIDCAPGNFSGVRAYSWEMEEDFAVIHLWGPFEELNWWNVGSLIYDFRKTEGDEGLKESWEHIWPLQMLFRIAQQKVALETVESLRAEQQKSRDRETRDVRVVTLRKAERAPAGTGSHASPRGHVVPAHWTKQWYPSMKAHRNLFIDDYFRGDPDDLMPRRPTVYNVAR